MKLHTCKLYEYKMGCVNVCTDHNECNDSIAGYPCYNGGICRNQWGSFVCTCPQQWTGPDCQTGMWDIENETFCFWPFLLFFKTLKMYHQNLKTGTFCMLDINNEKFCFWIDLLSLKTLKIYPHCIGWP